MKQATLIFILTATLYSCGQTQEKKADYPLQVGDIDFNSKIDNPNFKLCDETRVLQYYNFGKGLQYKGEKITITEYFKNGLKTKEKIGETGVLTIRFIVNCNGQTGRFRIQGMDNDYNEKKFGDNLANQVLTMTSKLDGWIAGELEGKKYDYYQYLAIRFENGKLIEIMP
jgi:hypothetical protein